MKLYVAGPMTGIPQHNFPAFDAATEWLRNCGHEVTSPAEMDRALGYDPKRPETESCLYFPDIMRNDLKIVLESDGIVLLDGWERSPGARLERIVAESTGRKVFLIHARSGILVQAPKWEHEAIYKMGQLC
jgi:hypothetical protein